MAYEQEWNKGQLRAWEYALSFVDQGIGTVAALKSYRAGGGAIRTEDWGILFNQLKTSGAEWQKLQYLGANDTIPAKMFSKTSVNFQNTYTVRFQANITSEITGERETVIRQIGFENRPTQSEMFSSIEEYLKAYEVDPAAQVNYITDIKFFKRKG